MSLRLLSSTALVVALGALPGSGALASGVQPPHGVAASELEIAPNGLVTNRLAQNRLAQNRLAQNRLAQNRLAQNRLVQNRLAQNGAALGFTEFSASGPLDVTPRLTVTAVTLADGSLLMID